MIEVSIENFQSIEKVHFKIDRFTAFVGRSNIGKSAVVRALRNALTGASGTDFVRHGASCERRLKDNKKCRCQTTVRIQMPKIDLVWEKGDSVNRYTVTKAGETPVVYDKVDRGTPEFLQPGFSPVKIGDDAQLVQVSEQFNPIFLLNVGGPTVADVLSDVAHLDDINEAMRLSVKDRKEASATRTIRERDVAATVSDLSAYDGLDLAVQDVQRVEQHHAQLSAKQQSFETAKQFVNQLEELVRGIRSLQAATKPELPNLVQAQALSAQVINLDRLHEAHTSREAAVEVLAGVEQIVLPDLDRVQKLSARTLDSHRLYDAQMSREAAVQSLSGVEQVILPDLALVEATKKQFDLVSSLYRRAQVLRLEFDRGKALTATKEPDLAALQEIAEKFRLVQALFDRSEALPVAIAAIERQLKAAEVEETTVLKELQDLGMCPTCAQPISAGHHLHLEEAS